MFNRLPLRSSAVAEGILAASIQISVMAQGGFAGPGRY